MKANKCKKFFLMVVVSILINGFGMTAQKLSGGYFTEGKTWTLGLRNLADRTMTYSKLEIVKDTIIAGKPAKKLLETFDGGFTTPVGVYVESWPYYVCEQGNVIYNVVTTWGLNYFRPIIDFNVRVGDILSTYDLDSMDEVAPLSTTKYIVEDDGFITLYGHVRRVLTLKSSSHSGSFYWIEGIGVHRANSWGNTDYLGLSTNNSLAFCGALECYQDGELIYSKDEFDRMLLEQNGDLSALFEIAGELGDKNGLIYDLMGRRIECPVPGRIYVSSDGRKFIQR